MKTRLLSAALVAALVATTGVALAGEAARPKLSFEQKKELALKVLDERARILGEERACIAAATAAPQLEGCLHKARQSRTVMGEQLRAEMGKKPR